MMQRKHLISIILLAFLTSGCQIFPYVYTNPTRTPNRVTDYTPSPITTATIEHPTLTPEKTHAAITPNLTLETPTQPHIMTQAPPPALIPQPENPFYLPNFNHPDAGCHWTGVAGQVFDESGAEILDLTIILGNRLDGDKNQLAAITGLATAYGLGGYEIQFLDKTFESSDMYWVQVFDQEGQPVSKQVFFDTFDDCEKNLILINFVPRETNANP